MGQEQLGGLGGRLPRPGRARGQPELVQAPGRWERLVERRAAAAGPPVAVPAAVRPLPGGQRPGQQLGPRVAGQAEPAGDRQRVALLGGAAAGQPVDHRHRPAVLDARQPVEHGRGGGLEARLAGRGGQLDQGDEPPVGPGPLAVGPDPEAAVRPLAGQQRPDLRALQAPGRVGGQRPAVAFAQQVAAGEVADRRLVRGEQPGQCGRRRVVGVVHGGGQVAPGRTMPVS